MTSYRFRPRTAHGLMFAAALVLAGCAPTPTIRTDFDQTVDFSRFRSFSWVFSAPPQGMNPLVFQRVRDSIDRTLQHRFTPGSPGEFAVAFTIGRRDTVQVTDFGAYGSFYRSWGWGMGRANNVDIRTVSNGTLVIDIYDTTTRRPVWHGMASQQINPNRPPSQAQIDSAIAQVLARFPPGSASN